MIPYGVCDHLCKFLKAKFTVSVLVSFHYSLVHNLLQLRVLPTKAVSPDAVSALLLCGGERTLRLLPTIIFNTKKSSPLEMYPSRSMS